VAGILRLDDEAALRAHALGRRPHEREHAFAGAEVGQPQELIGRDEAGQTERGRAEEPQRPARADHDVGRGRRRALRLAARAA
jgi:hypothetical protein